MTNLRISATLNLIFFIIYRCFRSLLSLQSVGNHFCLVFELGKVFFIHFEGKNDRPLSFSKLLLIARPGTLPMSEFQTRFLSITAIIFQVLETHSNSESPMKIWRLFFHSRRCYGLFWSYSIPI